MSAYREFRLFLDGGGIGKRLPVRCVGSFDGEQVEISEVWVAASARQRVDASVLREFNIIENLKRDLIDDLEAEAAGQIMWESVR